MSRLFSEQPLFAKKTIVLLIVALVLMLLDANNPSWFAKVRSLSHASMQSIYQLSLIPSFAQEWSDGQLMSKEALRRDNLRLQAELAEARVRLQSYDHLVAQNARLTGVLSVTESTSHEMMIAKVIGTDTNPLKQIVVLDKGTNHGVQIGQPVIDEKGILGQVLSTYPNTSRLLLITDEQQSVAVTIARTGQRAMVTGTGMPDSLSLDYIFKTSDVQVGDELISSGLGGRMPAGYKVGVIESIDDTRTDNFADITVTPAANFLNSRFVVILKESHAN